MEAHPAFEPVREQQVRSQRFLLQEFRHRATGARHIHFANDDEQNAFMVAFRTIPKDDTGVAHILEHTVLCGSEKFPVRDPFFLMIRRSLHTFMNAFTAADWTAYPFATCNEKDFDNLLRVYLDSAFAPLLSEHDFAQEGRRLDFAESGNTAAPLVWRGVVYNEMKGEMSAPTRQVWHGLCRHLFPASTYHYNSGGEPAAIPRLTWKQLRDFHRRFYHPANSVFFTYGNIAAARHQARFEELALANKSAADADQVDAEQRLTAPIAANGRHAAAPNTAAKPHVVVAWLLDDVRDIGAVLRARFLELLLLDNASCPLQDALQTSSLGDAPSPLCGLDDDAREMVFAAGLEGARPEDAEKVEQLILSTIAKVAEDGLPAEQVESALHQLELAQREIGGDGFPRGLQLMLGCLPSALHGGDIFARADLDDALNTLRAQAAKPDFVRGLAQAILDNPHRVRYASAPDFELAKQRDDKERAALDAMGEKMSGAEKKKVAAFNAELQKRQRAPQNADALPKVTPADVSPRARDVAPRQVCAALTGYAAESNGLAYARLIAPLSLPAQNTDARLDSLYLLASFLPEVGSGGRDYRAAQAAAARVSGGFGAAVDISAKLGEDAPRAWFFAGGKCLARNISAFAQELMKCVEEARFDEAARLRELLAEWRLAAENSITGRGHMLAMAAAARGMSPLGALSHRTGGLEGIRQLVRRQKACEKDDVLSILQKELEAAKQLLCAQPRHWLLVTDEEHLATAAGALLNGADSNNGGDIAPAPPLALSDDSHRREAWVANAQVNYCAAAFAAPPHTDEDAPALTVLSPYLFNNFLHTAIREQGGAYGSGAQYDGGGRAFKFFSYRDPRLRETFAVFEAAVRGTVEKAPEKEKVEEAILGAAGKLDRPGAPAGEARKAFSRRLHGVDKKWREDFRRRLLSVSGKDLQRVAEKYLQGEGARSVVTGAATAQDLAKDGWAVEKLED